MMIITLVKVRSVMRMTLSLLVTIMAAIVVVRKNVFIQN